jgi:hypothetical protein
MPSYRSAANRHSKDANQLFGVNSFDGASHLAGLSGECAIKSVLCGPCGVPINPNGPPIAGTGTAKQTFGHFPALWAGAGSFLSGQTINSIPGISALLGPVNPYAGWQVHDRYEADGTVSAADAQVHLQAAVDLGLLVEAAYLSGIVLA